MDHPDELLYPTADDMDSPVVIMAAAMARRIHGADWETWDSDGGHDHYIVLAWAAFHALNAHGIIK